MTDRQAFISAFLSGVIAGTAIGSILMILACHSAQRQVNEAWRELLKAREELATHVERHRKYTNTVQLNAP